MGIPKKRMFSDSRWYSVFVVVFSILLIIFAAMLAGVLAIGGVYLIIRSSQYIGGWWILLMSLHISLFAGAGYAVSRFRKNREIHALVGDELYFLSNGTALKRELLVERVKRRLREWVMHSAQEKSEYEKFLEACETKRLSMQEQLSSDMK